MEVVQTAVCTSAISIGTILVRSNVAACVVPRIRDRFVFFIDHSTIARGNIDGAA